MLRSVLEIHSLTGTIIRKRKKSGLHKIASYLYFSNYAFLIATITTDASSHATHDS